MEIGYEKYEVQSFPFEQFDGVSHCRLVMQRQRKGKGEQLDLFDGEYTYRCILTNDWDMTDEAERAQCLFQKAIRTHLAYG